MELEYSDRNRRRSKLYIAVGVIVALVVAGTVYVALQASGLTDDVAVETRRVVVATVAIPSRQPIGEGDVTVREVVADPTNETAFTSVDEVVGRITGVAVSPGQLLSPNLLASTTEGQTFSILAPGEAFDPDGPDLRAVSVTVADANAVAGTLTAGQRVDLIVTMQVDPNSGRDGAEEPDARTTAMLAGPSTKVTLQQVTILARNGDIYILRADVATSEKIAELTAAGGVFTMVLRPEQDDRLAETEGSTIDRLIEEFGFPVPVAPEFEDRQAGN
ncbi:MAG TPA: Flp pilus assembly protein CpaB [Candidatus Angelobacter sp.]|nr:Flp pilus assembly protein CpaB [Candidatus Angelobacter sp.]